MLTDIKLQVSGRLGNQLFEWSYAHFLAKKFGVKVQPVIDSRHFKENEASIFKDPSLLCSAVQPQINRESIGIVLAILDKLNTLYPGTSNSFERSLKVSRQQDAYILDDHPFRPRLVTGFFIDSSHVAENADHLFMHLANKFRAENIESKVNTLIGKQSFQAVHIRRGDFIPLKDTFGLLDSSWYSSNLAKDLPLILATDDVKGSSELIKNLKPEFILNPKEWNEWETLGILAQAERLIIANSTFSWWAGFCAVQNGKVCIVPKPFYLSEPWKDSHLQFEGFTYRDSSFEY